MTLLVALAAYALGAKQSEVTLLGARGAYDRHTGLVILLVAHRIAYEISYRQRNLVFPAITSQSPSWRIIRCQNVSPALDPQVRKHNITR